jgi:hypothetical protein
MMKTVVDDLSGGNILEDHVYSSNLPVGKVPPRMNRQSVIST